MENKKLNIAVYIRVSSLEQANSGFWKDLQLTKIKKYIEYNSDKGWQYNENLVYKDLWISWSKDEDERPWLKKLKEDIEAWKVDIVIVWRLDRLARKTIILLELVEFFKDHNIVFVSTDESIDTNTATWTFFLTILGAIAEMDRQLITEKTYLWRIEAIKKWFFWVGWNPKFWFTKNLKTKELELVDEEIEVVREVFNLYVKEWKSLWEVSNVMKSKYSNMCRWDTTKVSRMLSDEAYIWRYPLQKTKLEYEVSIDKNTWKKIKKPKTTWRDKKEWLYIEVETIIEPEIYHEAQERLVYNRYRLNNHNKPVINHMFWWLLRCWVCNGTYKGDKGKANIEWVFKPYYRCWRNSAIKHGANKCFNSQIRESELIEKVFKTINDLLVNPNKYIEKYLREHQNKDTIEDYKKELEENNKLKEKTLKNIDSLYEEFVNEDSIDLKWILKKKIEDYKTNLENLEDRNEEIKEIIEEQKWLNNIGAWIEEFIKSLEVNDIYKVDREWQITLLNKIIKKIVIWENRVDVFFKFTIDKEDEEILSKKKTSNEDSSSLLAGLGQMVIEFS